jgi:ABC-2 type transport system permease protein
MGLDEEKVKSFFKWTPVQGLGLVSMDKEGKVKDARAIDRMQTLGIPLILVLLMFIMIMMGAMPLVNSVLEEKTQRISEIMLGSARPFELMLGKLLGNLGVSFTAALVYIVGGFVVSHYMGASDIVPFHLLPWFFVYMVAAIFMTGAMGMAIGAACNDAKEVQSLMMPVMLPVMLPMFVLFPVLKEPTSAFATWLSFFPPCTPMLMLLRQASPAGIPGWQPWVGLIGVLLFTVIYVWAAGRIFRIGLLSQGKPPKIRNLLRWIVKG